RSTPRSSLIPPSLSLLMPPPPPSPSLFPYTTLFRSLARLAAVEASLPADPLEALDAAAAAARAHARRLDEDCLQLYAGTNVPSRSEEHTSELQSRFDLVCRLLLEKKNNKTANDAMTS